jgi:hypothetical protein
MGEYPGRTNDLDAVRVSAIPPRRRADAVEL